METRRGGLIPGTAGVLAVGYLFLAVMVATGLPTPLYPLYKPGFCGPAPHQDNGQDNGPSSGLSTPP